VKAKVDIVTADAVTDEKKGSYYPATTALAPVLAANWV
jgi:hypothetical protein